MSENTNTQGKQELDSLKMIEGTVFLTLSFKEPGNSRKLRDDQYTVDSDKEMTRASKKLLESLEWQKVKQLQSECRDYLWRHSLPSSIKGGIYMVRVEKVPNVVAGLKERFEAISKACDALCAPAQYSDGSPIVDERGNALTVYDNLQRLAANRLKGLYDPNDYLSCEEFRAKFQQAYQVLSFTTPKALKKMDPQFYQEEIENNRKAFADALESARAILQEELLGMVTHAQEKLLGKAEDGKRKIFRDSLISNIKAFMDTFDERNAIVDSDDLKALVAKMKAVLTAQDGTPLAAQALRDSEALRVEVGAKMGEIKTALDGMVIARGRKIKLDED